MYQTIRNIHLLLASFSLPFLIMYGVSAVQMSHSTWFDMKPSVKERDVQLDRGQTDARTIARAVMDRAADIKGDLTNIQPSAAAMSLRIVVPGTVHDIRYDPKSGVAHVKTSIAGVMGMLNRLHHWAGFWHEAPTMKAWAAFVALVSAALVLVGISGLYMWFTRRAERRLGVALLAINLIVAVALLALLRVQGP